MKIICPQCKSENVLSFKDDTERFYCEDCGLEFKFGHMRTIDQSNKGKYLKNARLYIKRPIPIRAVQMPCDFEVMTLEGRMEGRRGDWLVEGVEGEIYVIRDEIFRKTYIEVNVEGAIGFFSTDEDWSSTYTDRIVLALSPNIIRTIESRFEELALQSRSYLEQGSLREVKDIMHDALSKYQKWYEEEKVDDLGSDHRSCRDRDI